MNKKPVLHFFILLVFAVIISGCATTTQKALGEAGRTLDLNDGSILLFTVSLKNNSYPNTKMTVGSVLLSDPSGDVDSNQYKLVGKAVRNTSGTVQFIAIKLQTGNYKLISLNGSARGGLFAGNFNVPIFQTLYVPIGKIMYLGRINATNRKRRNSDEVRSGSVIPVIDQAALGLSTGTFDVEILDKYDEDTLLSTNVFPALYAKKIERDILPAWQRPTREEIEIQTE